MDHHSKKLIDGAITAETEQTIQNIKKIYMEHDNHQSTRITFTPSGLAKGAKIEIDVVAIN
jgi:enamine deaminase RidA (YjgF/YER057c/UK114 family)